MVLVDVDFEVDFALRGICDAELNNLVSSKTNLMSEPKVSAHTRL